jgi:hypothetical protein
LTLDASPAGAIKANDFVFLPTTAVQTDTLTPNASGNNQLDFHNVTADLSVDLTGTVLGATEVAKYGTATVNTLAATQVDQFNNVVGGQGNNTFTTGNTLTGTLTLDASRAAATKANDFIFLQPTTTQVDTLAPSDVTSSSTRTNTLDFLHFTLGLNVDLSVRSLSIPSADDPGLTGNQIMTTTSGSTPYSPGKPAAPLTGTNKGLTLQTAGKNQNNDFTSVIGGASGDDYIIGRSGYASTLTANGSGDNTLIGGNGDTLTGGSGNDQIYVNTDGTYAPTTTGTTSPYLTPLPTLVSGLGVASATTTVVDTGNGIVTQKPGSGAATDNQGLSGDKVVVAGVLNSSVTITTGTITGISNYLNGPVNPITTGATAGNTVVTPAESVVVSNAQIEQNLTVNGIEPHSPTNADSKDTSDNVLIAYSMINQNLTAALAAGDDLYSQQLCYVHGNCAITLGNGSGLDSNGKIANEAYISGLYTPDASNGLPAIDYIGTTTQLANLISGTLIINGAAGSALMILDHATVKGAVTLTGGTAGDNTIGLSANVFNQMVILDGGPGGNNTLDGTTDASLLNTFNFGMPTVEDVQTINGTI